MIAPRVINGDSYTHGEDASVPNKEVCQQPALTISNGIEKKAGYVYNSSEFEYQDNWLRVAKCRKYIYREAREEGGDDVPMTAA